MTHVEAFMRAEAEAQDEREREDDPVGYALRTGEIDHLSPADLRKYDELRADANEAAAAERTFTYEDMRLAFESGYASCQDSQDLNDAWDEHCAFLDRDSGVTHEYAFDVKLFATIRVTAPSEFDARAMVRQHLDAADCNGGAWPNGDPILFEASIDDDELPCIEIDGEPKT